ncbi:MAG: GGDEF domain-containing protein [Campylobacterales bacterium]|nr:GGDEF domain-containing protein [Campylobacterales bacterium]
MTINQIVRNTVERLKTEGKAWTPEYYTEAFCAEAKKVGIVMEECKGVERFVVLLDKKTQEELKQYRVRTTAELIRFLISKLSRMNPNDASMMVELLISLVRSMAQSINVLHNPEASALAKKTISILEAQGGKTQLELLKQAWENFATIYDDAFLMKLSPYGQIDKFNLKKTVEGLSSSSASSSKNDFTKFSSLLMLGLSPSIAPQMNDQLMALTQKVQANPEFILEATFEQEIKMAIAMRIALDKKNVNDMLKVLDTLLGKLSVQLIDLIERSDISSSEIKGIKKDLEGLGDENTGDFKVAHKKLYTIATTLEEKVEVLSKDLKAHNDKVVTMGSRIVALEEELAEATQASREDFLTKLYNKRALEEFMAQKEADYERYGRNYCIVMFDLDHFKRVNDTYGHDAGDAVLRAFSQILKAQGRTNDIIGRFGGEEFVAILGDTDIEGAKIFANKVREHVQDARLMYQDTRIQLSVSAGVAPRDMYPSLGKTMVGADEKLYEAKKKGRNRVEPA